MALTEIKTSGIADDAVTTDKLANAINTERTANTAKTSTTINNNADNRVITGSGTANTLNGESGLTYDSGGMSITGDSDRDGIKITQSGNNYGEFNFNSNRSAANNVLGIIRSEWNSTEVASIYLTAGSDTTNKDDGQIKFFTSPDSGTGIQTRMTIDSSGIVTKPYTPSFFATINGGDNTSNINNVVPFDQTKHNTGSHFDTSTNKFIAPVAGVYYFCTQIWAKNGTSNMRFRFTVDDASNSYAADTITQHGWHGNSVNRENFAYNASIVYYLDVGDRMYLKVDNTNLTYYTAGASDPHTYFCGYLIG